MISLELSRGLTGKTKNRVRTTGRVRDRKTNLAMGFLKARIADDAPGGLGFLLNRNRMGVDTFGREVLEEAQKIHVLSAREWGEIWGNTSKVSPPQAALKVADFKTGLLPNLEVKVRNEWL